MRFSSLQHTKTSRPPKAEEHRNIKGLQPSHTAWHEGWPYHQPRVWMNAIAKGPCKSHKWGNSVIPLEISWSKVVTISTNFQSANRLIYQWWELESPTHGTCDGLPLHCMPFGGLFDICGWLQRWAAAIFWRAKKWRSFDYGLQKISGYAYW